MESRVPILVGTAIAFTTAACLVVILRLYTRYAVVHSLGIDDYTIAAAALLSVGVAASTMVQAYNGLGLHVEAVTEPMMLTQLKSLLAGEILYNLSQIATKVSFLLQYRRIFGETLGPWIRRIGSWLLWFLVVWGVAQEFLVVLACVPTPVFVPSLADHCIPSLVVWYLTSVMNIVTDFAVFLLPVPAVLKLRLPRRQKAMVLSIFCLGFFTCVISIVRLFTLRAAVHTTDTTWDNAPTSWWTTIELNCGIIISSIVTLRPLFRKLSSSSSSWRRTGSSLDSGQSTDDNDSQFNKPPPVPPKDGQILPSSAHFRPPHMTMNTASDTNREYVPSYSNGLTAWSHYV